MMAHKRNQSGATLIEAVAALGVLASIAAGAAVLSGEVSDDTRTSHAASHMMTIGAAVNYYVRNHRAEIETTATATTAFRIDVNDLVTDGLLPSGSTSRNALGQDVCALVFQPSPGAFNAFTIGEGTTLDDASLGYMAGTMGSGGGGVYAKDPSRILGSGGTWEVATSGYAGKVNTDATGAPSQRCSGAAGTVQLIAGTPVLASWFAEETMSQYLSRVDTGDPNDTTMRTRLKLGGNTVGNLTVVPAVTAGAPCAAAENGKPGYGTNNSFECSLSGGSYKWMAVTHCGTGNAAGDLASSSNGELMVCKQQGVSTLWKRSSGFWQEPVQNWTALNAIGCNANTQGETRVVQDAADGTGRPRVYTCNGANWMALGLDDNGDLMLVRNVSATGTVSGARGQFSRDGIGPCCGDTGTISLAENTISTGRTANISLHNGGLYEGNIELAASGENRVRFYANGGAAMGVEATGNIRTSESVLIGAGRSVYSPGRMHIEAEENLYLKPWAAAGEVFVGGGGGNGRLTTYGRLTTNEFVQIGGVATEGGLCAPNGLVGRNAAGVPLSCQSGRWKGVFQGPLSFTLINLRCSYPNEPGNTIIGYYKTYLDRCADESGLMYWTVLHTMHGYSLEYIRQQIVNQAPNEPLSYRHSLCAQQANANGWESSYYFAPYSQCIKY